MELVGEMMALDGTIQEKDASSVGKGFSFHVECNSEEGKYKNALLIWKIKNTIFRRHTVLCWCIKHK